MPELELELDELLARPELDELEELELDELRPELEEEELEELEDELDDEELEELLVGVPVQAASARLTKPTPMSDRGSVDPVWIFIMQAL